MVTLNHLEVTKLTVKYMKSGYSIGQEEVLEYFTLCGVPNLTFFLDYKPKFIRDFSRYQFPESLVLYLEFHSFWVHLFTLAKQN
jgi:hypothetical protein